jgi:hypothetical protein
MFREKARMSHDCIKRWINGIFEGWIGSEEMNFESGMGLP